MEPNVTVPHQEVGRKPRLRLLALVRRDLRGQIRHQLASLGVNIDFISKAAELSLRQLSENAYQVVLLPATLPGNGWWSLWGEIALINPRPEILVYAQAASFQLWSGVLEIGGYDVLVEPFSAQQLQQAVMRAAVRFTER